MYLCNCNGLTVGEVIKACSGGLSSATDVFNCFNVEQCCGKCVPEIKQFILNYKRQTNLHSKVSKYQEMHTNSSV